MFFDSPFFWKLLTGTPLIDNILTVKIHLGFYGFIVLTTEVLFYDKKEF